MHYRYDLYWMLARAVVLVMLSQAAVVECDVLQKEGRVVLYLT
jgi:hypothetical protein